MFGRKGRRKSFEIAPDEIFADAQNLAEFNTDRFEGRVERPLSRRPFFFVGAFLFILGVAYLSQAFNLEVRGGIAYAQRADNNQLTRQILFADRGLILDRTGRVLADNVRTTGNDFSTRLYAAYRGIAHAVGYAKPPAKDSSGTYFRETSVGVDGSEAAFDGTLAGVNGAKLTEGNAVGQVVSESTEIPAQNGKPLTLSIDADVSEGLYDAIAGRAEQSKFSGGAGVIMDVRTGELLALVSYPEFSLQTMSDGTDTPAIAALLQDKHLPFLDRAVAGLYTPGSIVKPVVASGALTEGVINENTQILSTGSISVPNPYDPAHPSIFKDWRPQGWVDVRHAIAVSSDVFFYEVGGGFENQPGLGIDRLGKYLKMFGYGSPTGLQGFTESAGTIPSPSWKAQVFPGDPWRIGDTYHTAIGQYGVTVTPLQVVRAIGAIADGGVLWTPTLLASSTPESKTLPIAPQTLQIVREGMRMGVAQNGTAAAVNVPFVHIAAKTGTAQLGTANQFMNSWITGFFPFENPHYAFAIVLEKAPAGTLVGAPAAALDFFTWLHAHHPEYLQ